MAFGLETYDAAGNVITTTDTRHGTVLGIFDTGTTDGYIVNNALAIGTPFWASQSLDVNYNAPQPAYSVAFTGSEWRLSWNGVAYANCRVVYGVY
jgi:hypothetical protein